ncbi:hypothetical protein [Sorangium sp. So ce426]|uniref:hypothetical protein n=1 Tax=Sorangium sp. So ce426 TaxID=3133312 RepID=UPI003F5B5E43
MRVRSQEGKEEGLTEGEATGKAAAILAFLAARGISVSADVRARISTCRDASTLGLRIARAATAASVEEVISTPIKKA